ncbi:MAG: Flp family type IVb pilin [Proteobacteria bacterium]|nr:Flp family type IVb pilin [Pseudomonadota bacterium]
MSKKQSNRTLRVFRTDESGATAIEYSLIAAGIAAAIIATISGLGTSVKTMWETIGSAFG